jgi:hypothetical protein
MIDKYCVYIYSLHYVQREYIYHTTNRREVGIRTQLPSAFYHTDVRTDCAPLIEVRGWSDVSDCTHPLDGQTSINQFPFEKAIFNDAFHDVVNDAVNDARLVTPIPVAFGVQQE